MLKLNNMPRFDSVASFSIIPSFNEVDIDQQLANQENFKYYSTHEFYANTEIQNYVKISLSQIFIVILEGFPQIIPVT